MKLIEITVFDDAVSVIYREGVDIKEKLCLWSQRQISDFVELIKTQTGIE